MSYRLIRPLLFALEPERAHALTLASLRLARRCGVLSLTHKAEQSVEPVTLMGLQFPNRVGIAAGLDKNGVCIDALGALGVGFVEVGTVTPKPQAGNPRPRIFRLPASQALINRMGFPNDGVDALCAHLQRREFKGICGVNIGKNATTPLENASDDYVKCLHAVAAYADYVVVNVSSPNTVGLRSLQAVDQLGPMLLALLRKRERLLPALGRNLPLLVKIAPDLEDQELEQLAKLLLELKIDGVIATNTTLQRSPALGRLGQEKGGLSGAPLRELSLATVRRLRHLLGTQFPIIGVGGIASLSDAQAMRVAGADLVQVYTGLIYEGPGLINTLTRGLRN
jgi:dihydroorotate dehydrogenase